MLTKDKELHVEIICDRVIGYIIWKMSLLYQSQEVSPDLISEL